MGRSSQRGAATSVAQKDPGGTNAHFTEGIGRADHPGWITRPVPGANAQDHLASGCPGRLIWIFSKKLLFFIAPVCKCPMVYARVAAFKLTNYECSIITNSEPAKNYGSPNCRKTRESRKG